MNTGNEVAAAAEYAGKEAAHEAEKAVENAAVDLQVQLDAANERAENAEIVAEQIAQAAIEGERGERIAEIQRGLSECQTQQAESRDALRGLEMQLSQMQATLQTILTSQAASTPTPLEPQAEVTEIPITEEAAAVLEATTADPLETEEASEEGPPVVVAVPRKRNWM